MAIVIAVACGIVAVCLPVKWRKDAGEVIYEKEQVLYLSEIAEYEVAQRYDMSADDYHQLIEARGELPDGKRAIAELNRKYGMIVENQRNNIFWYRLSRNEMIGMVGIFCFMKIHPCNRRLLSLQKNTRIERTSMVNQKYIIQNKFSSKNKRILILLGEVP